MKNCINRRNRLYILFAFAVFLLFLLLPNCFGYRHATASAAQEKFICHFEQAENLNDSFIVNGEILSAENAALFTKGAGVQTKATFSEFIMYIRVKCLLNPALTVTFSDGNDVTISTATAASASMLKVSENTRVNTLLAERECTIYLRVQGDRVTVGYASSQDPVKLLSQSIVEFRLPERASDSVIGLRVGKDSAMLLQKLSVYSLSYDINIGAQDYDPDLEVDPDRVKPEFGENDVLQKDYTGLWIGLGVGIPAVLAGVAITVAVVLKKKRSKQ